MFELAFDIAERFQTPVFVASDLDIGMNDWMIPRLTWSEDNDWIQVVGAESGGEPARPVYEDFGEAPDDDPANPCAGGFFPSVLVRPELCGGSRASRPRWSWAAGP